MPLLWEGVLEIMYKKLIGIGIIFVFLIVGFSGCNDITNPLKSDKDKFIGSWKTVDTEQILTFVSDGTIIGDDGKTIEWELLDGKMVWRMDDKSKVYDYSFSNNDNALTISPVGESWEINFERID